MAAVSFILTAMELPMDRVEEVRAILHEELRCQAFRANNYVEVEIKSDVDHD